jgi:hypothetical protein
MTEPALLMDSTSGPLVTIRPAGSLDATVTIAVTSGGRLQVEAAWRTGGRARSAVRAIDGHFTARTLANEWANSLAAGREPLTA